MSPTNTPQGRINMNRSHFTNRLAFMPARRSALVVAAVATMSLLGACGSTSTTAVKTNAAETLARTMAPTTLQSQAVGAPSTEAYCQLMSAFGGPDSPAKLLVLDGTVNAAEAKTKFATLREVFARLVAASPGDVRPSIETFTSSLLEMGAFYDRYQFDGDAVAAAVANDPAVADEFDQLMAGDPAAFDAATTKVEQYTKATCAIDLAGM
jgi:hypothetical protein